jgi:hypothetical protein
MGLLGGSLPNLQPGPSGFIRRPLSAWSPCCYVGLVSRFPGRSDTTASRGGARGSDPYRTRDDGRNGGDPGWKHRVAHQRVDQVGLAAFELADAGAVEAALGEPLDLTRGLARQRRKSRFGRELRQPSQVAQSLRRGSPLTLASGVGIH